MFTIILSGFNLARPYLIKTAIDDNIVAADKGIIEANEARQGIKTLGIIFLVLVIGEFMLGYVQTYLLQSTGKKIIMTLRNEAFSCVQRLPVAYFDKNPVGRIVTTVMNDTEALNEMYTEILVGF